MTENATVPKKIQRETPPYKMNRKIGSTTYNVSINFSKTSRENINDKIIRLIRNEAQK